MSQNLELNILAVVLTTPPDKIDNLFNYLSNNVEPEKLKELIEKTTKSKKYKSKWKLK